MIQDPPSWPDSPDETPHLVNSQPDRGAPPAPAPCPGAAAAGAGLAARRPPVTHLRVLPTLLVTSLTDELVACNAWDKWCWSHSDL